MPAASPKEGQGAGRPFIFVVDDELEVCEVVVRSLRAAGYEVAGFQNPVVACSAFATASRKPDLLIVDYAMPEMSGIELLRRCRGLIPKLRALSISGTLASDEFRESDPRPDACLRKPFKRVELLAIVQMLVG